MGGTVFRSPQEGVDQFQKAVELISLIQQIATDPKIKDTVQEISKSLVKTQEISEEKKKEALDAEEVIAQANEAIEDLQKSQSVHDKKVTQDLIDINNMRKVYEDDVAKLEKQRNEIQEQAKVDKAIAETKLEQAKKLSQDAISLQKELDEKQKQIIKDWNSLAEEITALAQKKSDLDATFAEKEAVYQRKLAGLEADKATFDARVQKFSDALKG